MRTTTLLQNSSWSLLAWALPVTVVFLLTPVLLADLGPHRFGVLMLVLLVPTIAVQLDFGIGATAIRELAIDFEKQQGAARSLVVGFALTLAAVGAVIGLVLWLAAPPLSRLLNLDAALSAEAATALIRHCAVWAGVSIALQPPALLARAMQRLRLLAAAQTLSMSALWLGAWLLLRAGQTPGDVVVFGIALSCTVAALLAALLWQALPASPLQRAGHGTKLSERVRFASGMLGTQAASALVFQGDRYVVSALAGPATAGSYAAIVNLANKLQAVVAGLTAFLYPHFAGLFGGGRVADVRAAVNAGERIALLLVLPTVVPVLFLAGDFITLWLRSAGSADMALALQLLYAGFAVSSIAAPIGHAVLARGDSRFAAAFAWLTVVTFAIAATTLVPTLGLIGAAAAMALALATSIVFQFAARRRLNLQRDPAFRGFAVGLAIGCAAQAGLAGLLQRLTGGWASLLLIMLVLWLAFFAVRALTRRMSPEEQHLALILRGRLRL